MAETSPQYRVLVTDYVWPSTAPEREVLARIGAELIEAPDPSEATLASLAADVDAIMTCFAQVTPNVVRAAQKCVAISRYGVGVDNIDVGKIVESWFVQGIAASRKVQEVVTAAAAGILDRETGDRGPSDEDEDGSR